MGVIAKGILRGCQGLFTPVSLGYPLSVFNKNSTLKVFLCESFPTCHDTLFEDLSRQLAQLQMQIQRVIN